MPAITSNAPEVDTWVMTGATAVTCGSFSRIFPTLIDIGAPVNPTMNDEPGGITITSAPMPACRALESLRMPSDRPTINRMSVTSRAIATIEISDRIGRCAKLATIILFIMLVNPLIVDVFRTSTAAAFGRLIVQTHYLSARRLLESKLLVCEALVEFNFHNGQSDVVSLRRPLDFDARGKLNPVILLVIFVARVGGDVALLVINPLLTREQIGTAESDFSRQIPAFIAFPNHVDLVIRLFDSM